MLEPYWVGNREDVATTVAGRGLVLVQGIAQPADLLRLARSIATVVPHRDSDQDGLTTITDLGLACSGFAGFSSAALTPHTDGSAVRRPPTLLMTSCGQPAAIGGESLLTDGKAVHEYLAETEPDALRALYLPGSVLFGGVSGYLGSVFTRLDGQVVVRLRLDELAVFSPQVDRWLPALRAAIDRHTVALRLDPGQGYLLNNHRWLHGRRAFTGPRVMYRVIGMPLRRLRVPRGFRPGPAGDAVRLRLRPGADRLPR